ENSHLREIISKKDNEITDLSNPPPLSMNDSSQLDPEGTLSTLNPSSQIIPVGSAEVVLSPQHMCQEGSVPLFRLRDSVCRKEKQLYFFTRAPKASREDNTETSQTEKKALSPITNTALGSGP
ncbi:22124_t:CDS:2, partial [Gigaspora rosea]